MSKWISPLAIVLFVAVSAMATESRPPNILLIAADDMNYDSLGCMGITSKEK